MDDLDALLADLETTTSHLARRPAVLSDPPGGCCAPHPSCAPGGDPPRPPPCGPAGGEDTEQLYSTVQKPRPPPAPPGLGDLDRLLKDLDATHSSIADEILAQFPPLKTPEGMKRKEVMDEAEDAASPPPQLEDPPSTPHLGHLGHPGAGQADGLALRLPPPPHPPPKKGGSRGGEPGLDAGAAAVGAEPPGRPHGAQGRLWVLPEADRREGGEGFGVLLAPRALRLRPLRGAARGRWLLREGRGGLLPAGLRAALLPALRPLRPAHPGQNGDGAGQELAPGALLLRQVWAALRRRGVPGEGWPAVLPPGLRRALLQPVPGLRAAHPGGLHRRPRGAVAPRVLRLPGVLLALRGGHLLRGRWPPLLRAALPRPAGVPVPGLRGAHRRPLRHRHGPALPPRALRLCLLPPAALQGHLPGAGGQALLPPVLPPPLRVRPPRPAHPPAPPMVPHGVFQWWTPCPPQEHLPVAWGAPLRWSSRCSMVPRGLLHGDLAPLRCPVVWGVPQRSSGHPTTTKRTSPCCVGCTTEVVFKVSHGAQGPPAWGSGTLEVPRGVGCPTEVQWTPHNHQKNIPLLRGVHH
ncbi:transforming growth factor beta-1-induced transcript 1 protein isoform X2 [Opisthocomus hoazin]|uniref:transforming growth factor beta-1-induced transcript 1 protein isoform X2 n=1 Tax=Opisthocomus hoazin TaxID=30419 RepID=UPI003F52A68F